MSQSIAVTHGQTSNYDFMGSNIRVIQWLGAPWFVAADVCRVLAIMRDGNTSAALRCLAVDEKGVTKVTTPGGPQTLAIVSESGLYRITMRSNSVAARPFQDWVTKVVLPSIRKDGGYIMGEEKVATGEMSEDELVFKAMEVMRGKIERLRSENKTLTIENAVMSDELNLITVDEFRALSHLYLSQGDRVALGKRASALARLRGITLDMDGVAVQLLWWPLRASHPARQTRCLNPLMPQRCSCGARQQRHDMTFIMVETVAASPTIFPACC